MKTSYRAVVAGALASALLLGSAAANANAIMRVSGCPNYNDVWVLSDATTCWAYSGGVTVKLLNTIGANGGINAGFVKFSSGSTREFAKKGSPRWSKATVTYVAIY